METPSTEVVVFSPRHLDPKQTEGLYRQALTQAEAAVQNAWMSHVLNPHDLPLLITYQEAAAQLALLEEDFERVCRPSE